MLLAFAFDAQADSAAYLVNLQMQADYEALRPLVDGCSDLGELEQIRSEIESVGDLEEIRKVLEANGMVEFRGCPSLDGGSNIGISRKP